MHHHHPNIGVRFIQTLGEDDDVPKSPADAVSKKGITYALSGTDPDPVGGI